MNNFWKSLPKPFFALAPMEDVTDTSFRELVMQIAHPGNLHVVFTEFTSVDGLLHSKGFGNVSFRLKVSETERSVLDKKNAKIVAQIWGSDPEKFNKAAQIISNDFRFDGIDINMGCPVKKVVKSASCSALIIDPARALEIVQATKEGTQLPVSVKTRTGFKRHETERWIPQLLRAKPAAIILHGRYQSMLSNGEADWSEIATAVKLRNEILPECIIVGNGDVESLEQGYKLAHETDVDGLMIGRGIFKNIGLFSNQPTLGIDEKIHWMKTHIRLFSKNWDYERNPQQLKRFFKIYLNSFEGAHLIRDSLMHKNKYDEFLDILDEIEMDNILIDEKK